MDHRGPIAYQGASRKDLKVMWLVAGAEGREGEREGVDNSLAYTRGGEGKYHVAFVIRGVEGTVPEREGGKEGRKE